MSTPFPVSATSPLNDRYAVTAKLGAGSMGTVFLARDLVENRLVALKVMRSDRVVFDAADHLRDEFRAMVELQHPQIARVYDFGLLNPVGYPYYTREYVEGVPMPPGPPGDVSPRDHLRPILDLLSALHYLHARDTLHLDIHAGNVIVAADAERGSVLIDFGLVRAPDGARMRLTTARREWPPELSQGEAARKDVSGAACPQSDLFLVGRLLLYRLTGQADGEIRLPMEIPAWGVQLTLDLERIVSKSMQPSPTQRFASAAAFRDALLTVLDRPPRGWDRSVAVGEPRDTVSPTLGRDTELEQVEQLLRAVSGGHPQVLLLRGDPGLGKTQLLRETRVRAQLRGLDPIEIDFSRHAEDCTLLRAIQRREVGGQQPPEWTRPFDPKHGGSPKERARRVADAYFSSDERPLVLLCDNVDEADPESLLLLEGFLTEAQRRLREGVIGRGLVILATARAFPDPESGGGMSAPERLTLRPLTNGAVRALATSLPSPVGGSASTSARNCPGGAGCTRSGRARCGTPRSGMARKRRHSADLRAAGATGRDGRTRMGSLGLSTSTGA